jgi:hypothetical protein
MALGDSITAGLLAGPSTRSDEVASSLLKEGSAPVFGLPPPISEYRGLSYPIGSDPDAITFPNIPIHVAESYGTVEGKTHTHGLCIGVLRSWRGGRIERRHVGKRQLEPVWTGQGYGPNLKTDDCSYATDAAETGEQITCYL